MNSLLCRMTRFTLVVGLFLGVAVGCGKSEHFEAQRGTTPKRPLPNPAFSPDKIVDAKYIKQRLAKGLDPNAKNSSRFNQDYLLTFAVRHNAAETVEVLLAAGADVDIRSSGTKKTPLFQAAFDNRLKIARILVKHGADTNAVDMFGESPLREAILADNVEMVGLLLEAGCKPDHKNNGGKSISDIAREHGNPEIQKVLAQSK